MTNFIDGGPAFPRPASEYTASGTCSDGNDPIREQSGMSLHQYFAAHYQPTKEQIQYAEEHAGYADNTFSSILTDCALEHADAMIAAYEKRAKESTIEVATAPKGAYEALVYDLAKMLGCAENEEAIKVSIDFLQDALKETNAE